MVYGGDGNMKISFNGLRKNIARAFNTFLIDRTDDNLDELRSHLGMLMAIYDDDIDGDCDDLTDIVHIVEIDMTGSPTLG
jgi:hypothetical protein